MSSESDPATTDIEDTLAMGPQTTATAASEPESVKRIGPYRLLQLIGEGGMGEVWLAEQLEPRRRVALKVIKAGMDTKQVVARFESERQALALMDHPAIAKVFDGGSTAEGRPYFVMEYVAGVPITEHCDTHKLSTTARLELFTEVCAGVQHAHQKAVIHRDLKPSNILVSLMDGKAQPKIIDFGIAKATGYRLTEKTLFTEVGSVVGTPEYMSPEQADLTGQDIDTRTDVYSLGVILYELLTSQLPFGSAELRSSSYEELRRKLREVDPPKPSAKLTPTSAAEAARTRDTDSGSLRRQIEGDLDAITMKALEKDRNRRYGTPSEFAADIGRHLKNEPVVARPASQAYRLHKYARRHRAGVLVATGVLIVLVGFSVVMALQTRRIAHERDRANSERERANAELDRASVEGARRGRIIDFLTGMFSVSTPGEVHGNDIKAREVLDHASKEIGETLTRDPQLQAELTAAIANAYTSLGLHYQARALLAEKQLRGVVESTRQELGLEHPRTLSLMHELSFVLWSLRRFGEAESVLREVFEIQRHVLGSEHLDTLLTMNRLADVLSGEGRFAEAEKLQREVLDTQRRVFGLDEPSSLRAMFVLARTLYHESRFKDAEKLRREALETARRVLRPGRPELAFAQYGLACILARQGRRNEALELLRYALEHGLDNESLLGIPEETDFYSLHGDPRFEALIVKAKTLATPRIGSYRNLPPFSDSVPWFAIQYGKCP
jgi:eukaryotic-like serine/threonine-protein kinase